MCCWGRRCFRTTMERSLVRSLQASSGLRFRKVEVAASKWTEHSENGAFHCRPDSQQALFLRSLLALLPARYHLKARGLAYQLPTP